MRTRIASESVWEDAFFYYCTKWRSPPVKLSHITFCIRHNEMNIKHTMRTHRNIHCKFSIVLHTIIWPLKKSILNFMSIWNVITFGTFLGLHFLLLGVILYAIFWLSWHACNRSLSMRILFNSITNDKNCTCWHRSIFHDKHIHSSKHFFAHQGVIVLSCSTSYSSH